MNWIGDIIRTFCPLGVSSNEKRLACWFFACVIASSSQAQVKPENPELIVGIKEPRPKFFELEFQNLPSSRFNSFNNEETSDLNRKAYILKSRLRFPIVFGSKVKVIGEFNYSNERLHVNGFRDLPNPTSINLQKAGVAFYAEKKISKKQILDQPLARQPEIQSAGLF